MPDEFASITSNDALLDVIRAEIRAHGAISFEQFMDLALYHPTLGYYRSGKRRIGERGDYITSPYLSPIFGAIVGRQLADMWVRLDRPAAFDLVEIGAGDGRLLRDAITWAGRADRAFAAALRPLLVEPDAALRHAQRRTLDHLPVASRWVEALEEISDRGLTGCIVSNELVDSFPARRYRVRDGVLAELCAGLEGDAPAEIERPAPTGSVPPALRPLTDALPDGATFEVNSRATRWMEQVAGRLDRGFVLTFDYGYPRAQLYAAWRTQGTAMAFYRHAVSDDLLARPGEQDLTTHVDFTALALAGREHGLEAVGFTTQREFLTALGVHEAVSAPGIAMEETLARRRAVLALTDPGGLGRVRVLAQCRGADGADLAGFAGAPPAWQALLAGITTTGAVT